MPTKKRPRRNDARGHKEHCDRNATTCNGQGYTCLSCRREFDGIPADFLPLKNAAVSMLKRFCFLCEECSSKVRRGGVTRTAVVSAVLDGIHDDSLPERRSWLTVLDGSHLEVML